MDTSFGDLVKKIERQVKRAKTDLKGRAQAQKILDAFFAEKAGQVTVASVKTGVVVLDVASSALFQEIEGYYKEELLRRLREGGMAVKEVRGRLKSG
ncbi:MAG TPA: hypothetical protein VKX17_23445 [Planctomycetota bacterium]|nr:hypothetical protein [Planctomycetota bacterium]